MKTNKCINCGKPRGEHQAKTLHCPQGSKTRIGYISYSTVNKFNEAKK